MKETLWQRLVGGGVRLKYEAVWPNFAGPDWADRIMTVAVTDRFHAKQGRSTGRWISESGGRRLAVYLKRHYCLSWWRGLLATFMPERDWSPAMQEWRHLEWARSQGWPVPRAVAAGEFIGPWGRFKSFLAVEELADMLPLHEAIPIAAAYMDPVIFRRWKDALIAEVARLTQELHRRHYFHKDLYLCHFYIAQADTRNLPVWPGRVHLIDLHRLGHHPWTSWLWQVKDLAQLLYSSDVGGLTVRDRLHFWRLYRGRRGWRWLRRCVLWKWQRYCRHNL